MVYNQWKLLTSPLVFPNNNIVKINVIQLEVLIVVKVVLINLVYIFSVVMQLMISPTVLDLKMLRKGGQLLFSESK